MQLGLKRLNCAHKKFEDEIEIFQKFYYYNPQ